MKISKIVNNNSNWSSVSGNAQTGILNSNGLNKYYFGLEEWNNCEILKKYKLAYFDSFRSFKRTIKYNRIELINYNNGIVWYVGRLEGVRQINCEEIENIKTLLDSDDWLKKIENDFHNINDLKPIESNNYIQCWDSNQIVAPTKESFILNVKYKKMTFFENQINLTDLHPDINNLKRLSHLYNINSDLENLFNQ